MEAKDIISELRKIQPEGFNWSNPTESEMVKFQAIAEISFKAGKAEDRREVIEEIQKRSHVISEDDIDYGDFLSAGDRIIYAHVWQALQQKGE